MKGRILTATLALAFAAALGGGAALAEGDAEAGKKVFKKCKVCHSFDPGKKKIGPHLAGVVGRKFGIPIYITRPTQRAPALPPWGVFPRDP